MRGREVSGVSKYKWFLRQEIQMRKDTPPQAGIFHFPRGPETTGLDYTVILKYDLVWWPEADRWPDSTYLLAQYETDGTA